MTTRPRHGDWEWFLAATKTCTFPSSSGSAPRASMVTAGIEVGSSITVCRGELLSPAPAGAMR